MHKMVTWVLFVATAIVAAMSYKSEYNGVGLGLACIISFVLIRFRKR